MQLREAADMLGVHYQTAYQWVRQGALPARKTGRGYEVSEHDVGALAARRASGTAPRAEIRVRDWTVQAERLHAAILAGDETTARHVFARLSRGVSMLDLCERVVSPALVRVGEQWARGEVSIAVEHRASAICERLIAVRAHQPQGRPHGVAVVATPPGERHGLPALMAAACLREDRWLVHHLATDLPAAEVAGLARTAHADLVVLSAATGESVRLAPQTAQEITQSLPGVHVLTGQPGHTLSRLLQLARGTVATATPDVAATRVVATQLPATELAASASMAASASASASASAGLPEVSSDLPGRRRPRSARAARPGTRPAPPPPAG